MFTHQTICLAESQGKSWPTDKIILNEIEI